MKCKKCGNTENFERVIHIKYTAVWDGDDFISAANDEITYMGEVKCCDCRSYKIEDPE